MRLLLPHHRHFLAHVCLFLALLLPHSLSHSHLHGDPSEEALRHVASRRDLGPHDDDVLQPYPSGQHGPSVSTHEEVVQILSRFHRAVNDSASNGTAPMPKTYETVQVNASEYQGRANLIETYRLPQQGHLSLAHDPLRTVSVLEPGGIGGCPGGTNMRDGRVKPSETVAEEGLHARTGVGCVAAMNAGFFNTKNGTCYGNLISRG